MLVFLLLAADGLSAYKRYHDWKTEAKKYAYRQTKDGMVLSFVLHPDDVPKEIATAPIGQRYMVACAQIDDHENPIRPRATTDAEKALARANLICRDETYIQ